MTNEIKILAYILGITVHDGDHIEIPRVFDVLDYETGFTEYPDGFIFRVVADDDPESFEDRLVWVKDFESMAFKTVYQEYDSAEEWILSDNFDNDLMCEFGGMTAGAALNMVDHLSRFRVANGKSALVKSVQAADAYGKLLEAEENGLHGYSGGIFDPMYGGI